ncbi:N-acetylglucosamine-6-phosphate deacetylase [Salirhabdus euzebyi]|uniref:N-acetylglucosamine-6-phosphate deacetylase n=1 Tax=Salirhabdus euzebyi TaxID=394506 RepID=A0A841PWL7_9BACI|nr:N-acetylglucosamine-6-phosphate deacetylase [Salirhabdus euzebyi]MBB6451726.1 N-acetylglucosamine-6-phosphate deacetylase [Salirhabdus euzebyi]
MNMIIQNVHLYLPDKTIKGSILIEKGKIKAIGEALPTDHTQVMDGKGLHLIPGFIDAHIHGANGADMMDGTMDALDTMSRILPAEGTTAYLPTTITNPLSAIEQSLETVSEYVEQGFNKPGQAEIVGVHLEGPFIEKTKAGAQPKEDIVQPNIETFKQLQQKASGLIKTVTLAPELDANGKLMTYLKENGVTVSAGHTNATYEDIQFAYDKGLTQLTHLCNAMTGLHHREVGVVGAAMLIEGLRSELIVDGIHVNKNMVRILFQQLGPERIMLITDAMRAKCLDNGHYTLGGQSVRVKDQMATLGDGTLAGSVLRMIDGAQHMMGFAGATIRDVIKMASENPANQIGIYDRKGSIEINKDADLLLVDENLNLFSTWCRGELSYVKE